MTYTDILLTDLDSVRAEILEKHGVKCNIVGDRCIIKWNGTAHSCIDILECTPRTKQQAQDYYGNYLNGWCPDPATVL